MIRVKLQPEPANFDAKVRRPGTTAIEKFKRGEIKKLPSYWRHCLDDLWKAYDGICAYLCTFIHSGSGARAVEHFAPKSKSVDLAYEWRNYRLACSTINSWKSNFEDVLDPFEIDTGWFELEFPACKVVPAPGLAPARRRAVAETIERLRLNHAKCRGERLRYWDFYIAGDANFRFLKSSSPFLAIELDRQGYRRPNDA